MYKFLRHLNFFTHFQSFLFCISEVYAKERAFSTRKRGNYVPGASTVVGPQNLAYVPQGTFNGAFLEEGGITVKGMYVLIF